MPRLNKKQMRKVCPRGHKLGRKNLTPAGDCRECRRLYADYIGGVANQLKTHCPAGHAYEGDNLQVFKRGKYKIRSCRECRRLWGKEYYRTVLKPKLHPGKVGRPRNAPPTP
jgi:hypothetical protein